MRQKFEPRGGPAMCRTQKKKKKKRRENIAFVVLRSEHRVPKCDVMENEICEIMGFVKIF